MNVPHDDLFQNCINGSTPPNRRATRAPDKKSFKRHLLNHWPKFKIISQKCTSLYQNCTNGYAPLNKKTARTPDKKYLQTAFPPEPFVHIQNNFTGLFLMMPSSKIAQMVPVHWTKGLPEVKIRNVFKQYLLLNHLFKFHITSHERSQWCPLSKLHKWFCSTEQEGRQSSR